MTKKIKEFKVPELNKNSIKIHGKKKRNESKIGREKSKYAVAAKVTLPDPSNHSCALRAQRADRSIPVSHHISRPLANTLHDHSNNTLWFATNWQGPY